MTGMLRAPFGRLVPAGACLLVLLGCGSSDAPGTSGGGGGRAGRGGGGAAATGGTTNVGGSAGGALGTGGAASGGLATGGVASGGAATGGLANAGAGGGRGGTNAGGARAGAGGSNATGGTAASGGTAGRAATAGTTGAAGMSAAGGQGQGGQGQGGQGQGGMSCDGFLMPHPALSNLPNPAIYDATSTDVVVDRVTGRMWQRSLTAATFTQSLASSACADLTLSGFSDWRLPTILELVSLVDFEQVPAIDAAAFPNTTGSFWSSSPYVRMTDFVWYAEFAHGATAHYLPSTTMRTRCVRTQTQACYFGPRFAVQGTGNGATVSDAATKLVWQQAASATTMAWAAADTACKDASMRLPSVKELQTIVDYTTPSGATIDSQVFPNTPSVFFWTSSKRKEDPTKQAWAVSFADGSADQSSSVELLYRVRCVR